MINHLKFAVKRAFNLHRPGRNLLILPDDIFLISFPKSGSTWTRFLLANLLHPEEEASFANIHRMIPDPTGTSKRDFQRMPHPRIIKSHDCFDPRYPRVIYIVRDPRDVVLSQYHYHRKLQKIEDDSPLEKFVTRFLAGQTCPHGSWGQNVVSWLATREGDPEFLMLRYEDMLSDTRSASEKIAAFVGLSRTPEQLAVAIERSSAKRMRKLEESQTEKCELTKGSRTDLRFVRSASSGGWRSELPAALAGRLEAAWGPLMRHLGYVVNSSSLSAERDYESLGILLANSQQIGLRH